MAAPQPIGSLRSVLICPRGREGLDAAIADVKASTGTDIVTVTASVSNAEDIKRVVVRASAEFGPARCWSTMPARTQPVSFEAVADETRAADIDLKLMGYPNFKACSPDDERSRRRVHREPDRHLREESGGWHYGNER